MAHSVQTPQAPFQRAHHFQTQGNHHDSIYNKSKKELTRLIITDDPESMVGV
jgi:hypothetical protein